MNQGKKSQQQQQQQQPQHQQQQQHQQHQQQQAQQQKDQQQKDQQQPSGKAQQQMGEGSYEGTRDYNQRTEQYLQSHDVEADAQAARPRSEQEAREMKKAEREGRSHSKGEH